MLAETAWLGEALGVQDKRAGRSRTGGLWDWGQVAKGLVMSLYCTTILNPPLARCHLTTSRGRQVPGNDNFGRHRPLTTCQGGMYRGEHMTHSVDQDPWQLFLPH